MDTSQSVADRRSYDLYLTDGERRVVWSYSDHGVTLADGSIAWVAGSRQFQRPFREIVGVHLRLNYVESDAIATCRLRFADGSIFSVTSSSRLGGQDSALGKLYVEFVHDLHARLVDSGDPRISFTAGFSEGRYHFVMIFAFVAALLFIALPVGLLLISGDWKLAIATYTGLVLLWPVYKAMQANAPRSYDPRHVPSELMPVRLNLPPAVNPIFLDFLDGD